MLHIALFLASAIAGEGPRRAQAIDGGSWVTNQDYPAAAIEAGESGITSFRLDVAKDGTVARCTVTESSGSPLLDTTACALLRMRARFHPALDKNGRPVTDTYSARFRWILPDRSDIGLPGYVITTMKLAPDGTVTDCSTKTGGAFDRELSEAECDKVSNMEASGLSRFASEYDTLRYVISVSSEEAVFSFDPTGSEKTVLHESGDIYMSPERFAVRCVTLTKSEAAGDFCDAFWSENKLRPRKDLREAKKVTIRRILYGTPREAARPL
jgi:TonB family protein